MTVEGVTIYKSTQETECSTQISTLENEKSISFRIKCKKKSNFLQYANRLRSYFILKFRK